MIYALFIIIFLNSLIFTKLLNKIWLLPFILIFYFNAQYFILFSLGFSKLPYMLVFSIVITIYLILKHKPIFSYDGFIKMFSIGKNGLYLLTILLLVTLVKFTPLINIGTFSVVGPNTDAAHHAWRSLFFQISNYDITQLHLPYKGVNDFGLYPGGFHLIISFISSLLRIDIAKVIFISTNILCSLGLISYYFYLKKFKLDSLVISLSVLVVGLGSNYVFWLYLSEYPAIISLYLFPTVLIIFEEMLLRNELDIKIFLGFLIMGYMSFHSYIFLYVLFIIFVTPYILSSFNAKNFKNIRITLLILFLTSLPLTRNFISDYNFYQQTMYIENSLKNPLSGSFWGNSLNLSLPNLTINPKLFVFSWIINHDTLYFLVLLTALSFFIFPFNYSLIVLFISILLFYFYKNKLPSPFNRASLFSGLVFIPLLLSFLINEKKIIINFFKKILLGIYLFLVIIFSFTVINSFIETTSLKPEEYVFYNYLSKTYNKSQNNIFFIKNPLIEDNSLFWLKYYFLYKAKGLNIDTNISRIKDENILILYKTEIKNNDYIFISNDYDYDIYKKK